MGGGASGLGKLLAEHLDDVIRTGFRLLSREALGERPGGVW
jgi:hypothetical protein